MVEVGYVYYAHLGGRMERHVIARVTKTQAIAHTGVRLKRDSGEHDGMRVLGGSIRNYQFAHRETPELNRRWCVQQATLKLTKAATAAPSMTPEQLKHICKAIDEALAMTVSSEASNG